MRKTIFSRRDMLKGATALTVGAAAAVFAEPLRAAAPPPEAITPALIEAAKKEGKCAFYTAMDLTLAERLGKSFEQKFQGIAVRVERSGDERIFTRIAGVRKPHPRGRCRQHVGSGALHRLEA